MQLQHMRMLDQFQNGNLPLNLVRETRKEGRKREGTERRKDISAGRVLEQNSKDQLKRQIELM